MTEQELRDAILEILHGHNERGIGVPERPIEYYLEELKKSLTTDELTQLHEALLLDNNK